MAAGPSVDIPTSTTTIKFLCSYGGKILPRYPDCKLRYHGGQTRVLSIHRSISFTELLLKLGEMCGAAAVTLRCQLPTEDLDALVSITSDEDLANLIEEYDRVSSVAAPNPTANLKIRAFLSLPKKISSPTSTSTSSSSASSSPKSSSTPKTASRCHRQIPAPAPPAFTKHFIAHHPHHHVAYYAHGNPSRGYLIHNGNYWQ